VGLFSKTYLELNFLVTPSFAFYCLLNLAGRESQNLPFSDWFTVPFLEDLETNVDQDFHENPRSLE
jgi:hypothetical protein